MNPTVRLALTPLAETTGKLARASFQSRDLIVQRDGRP
jgi:hypothetical protein